MSNVISFPRAPRVGEHAQRCVTSAFLADPAPGSHAVQFYEGEAFLLESVIQFLSAGLQAGDRVVMIATRAHVEAFTELEPHKIKTAIETGQLVVLDAHDTLSKFMVGELPDGELFRALIARLIASLQAGDRSIRVRAYGEMVDVLWQAGNSRAAIKLEELWNEVGKVHAFTLLCAYVMGNFFKAGDAAAFVEVCENHSHVMPTESFVQLDDAHARLREISLLQQRAHALENEIEHRKTLEVALRDALRERSRIEDELRVSIRREQQARERAEASDAFKEVFLGMLGHDLRNPLNTILTTARLMTMRSDVADVPIEAQKRLARIVSSGGRMQRMIDQILDVTRARLATSGIRVQPAAQDLAPLVAKIVEDIQLVHPQHRFEVEALDACEAVVDADRFEQVVSNLLGNAVAHGDAAQTITVRLMKTAGEIRLSVHNYGVPIEPAFVPLLFDPFKRGGRPQGRSNGLGLGLYISERIVSAHGGTIEVASSEAAGTRFEVVLACPR